MAMIRYIEARCECPLKASTLSCNWTRSAFISVARPPAIAPLPADCFSFVDDSRTGYPPRALFCVDVAQWRLEIHPTPVEWPPFRNIRCAGLHFRSYESSFFGASYLLELATSEPVILSRVPYILQARAAFLSAKGDHCVCD